MDWFIAVLLAGEVGGSGRLRYMLKDTLTMLPLFGWAFWLHGCIYVSRAAGPWDRRPATALLQKTRWLDSARIPFWFVVFPEGTRYNPVRYPWQLQESAAAAASRGADPSDFIHVKFPRGGGFVGAVEGLSGRAAAVYDITTAYT
eukprot:CAMPEP_0182938170 /NCGR_PEP_ID=MMETSP0105_2-20130417/43399_1 /TAXON_ID=81532 ORGANISM="Acanthoeca-like sp., Strain 10tr" /NCGR_SAMPLE_ID=MMETSP0105_2 /ASSEMBLY_ACC=CAM_ASM_000205 /LENGTH=144 /DNA_ID=CAMNT_0025077451 /DNA_START=31 /DNA_END=462 /DNA_ORIENTATION=+